MNRSIERIDGFPATQFDGDLLPGSLGADRIEYAGNGKQIIETPDGRWIVGYSVYFHERRATRLFLAFSSECATPDIQFRPPILLSATRDAEFQPVFPCQGAKLGAPCLTIDAENWLHVFWDTGDGVCHTCAKVPEKGQEENLSDASSWRAKDKKTPGVERLCEGDGVSLQDIVEEPSGDLSVLCLAKGELLQRHLDEPRRERPLGAADRAVAALDDDGCLHVVFERRMRLFHLLAGEAERASSPPQLIAHYASRFPSLAMVNNRPFIAFQGEGLMNTHDNRLLYNQINLSGGSVIAYCHYDGERWRHGDVARAKEILLKRFFEIEMRHLKNPSPRFRNEIEALCRPAATVDAHGAPWLFYTNRTRRHTYFARWLGQEFSDVFEARGPYYDLQPSLLVQKRVSGWHNRIGWISFAANRAYFHHLQVPELRLDRGHEVTLIDMQEIQQASHVEHVLTPFEKCPENPLVGPGATPEIGEGRIMHCEVVVTGEGRFEMDFSGKQLKDNHAVSEDGIHWRIRNVEEPKITINGKPVSRDSRRFGGGVEDPLEPDPQKRFKGLYRDWQEGDRLYRVITSPNGVQWTIEAGLEPVVRGDNLVRLAAPPCPRHPRYRFLCFIKHISLSGRAMMMYHSRDALHWESNYELLDEFDPAIRPPLLPCPVGPIVLDADGAEDPFEEEDHDLVWFMENGLFMGHYDAFNRDGNQHVNKSLAVSRDGKHYYRIKRGRNNLPHGAAGEWDNGRIRTTVPFERDDKLWLYYAGGPPQFGEWREPFYHEEEEVYRHAGLGGYAKPPNDVRPWAVGLATLRKNGWTHVRLRPDAEQGFIATIPIAGSTEALHPRNLTVNACMKDTRDIQVELLDAATGATMAGYERAASRLGAINGVAIPVGWETRSALPDGGSAPFRIRFHLRSPMAKLFSFGFAG